MWQAWEFMCSTERHAHLQSFTWTVSGVPKSSEAEVTSALLRLPLLPERLLDRILRSGSTDVASLQARRCRAALQSTYRLARFTDMLWTAT